jgi:hypothetical protein
MKKYNFISEQEHEDRMNLLLNESGDLVDFLNTIKGELKWLLKKTPPNSRVIDCEGLVEEIDFVTKRYNNEGYDNYYDSKPKGMDVVLESLMIENMALKERVKSLESKEAKSQPSKSDKDPYNLRHEVSGMGFSNSKIRKLKEKYLLSLK